tara:strand:+ start:599 stop:1069 length:471 start_codon:yes stop_codon:yes gene_type:complete
MINDIQSYLTTENVFLIVNWGIIPFWVLLLIFPYHSLTKILVNSLIAPLILATGYVFFAYQIYLNDEILSSFNLYLGLDSLYALYSNDLFLLIFWLHFLSISLFVGAWIARDAERYMVPRMILMISLVLTYFSGPVGLIFYWIIRVFFSKKINFNE